MDSRPLSNTILNSQSALLNRLSDGDITRVNQISVNPANLRAASSPESHLAHITYDSVKIEQAIKQAGLNIDPKITQNLALIDIAGEYLLVDKSTIRGEPQNLWLRIGDGGTLNVSAPVPNIEPTKVVTEALSKLIYRQVPLGLGLEAVSLAVKSAQNSGTEQTAVLKALVSSLPHIDHELRLNSSNAKESLLPTNQPSNSASLSSDLLKLLDQAATRIQSDKSLTNVERQTSLVQIDQAKAQILKALNTVPPNGEVSINQNSKSAGIKASLQSVGVNFEADLQRALTNIRSEPPTSALAVEAILRSSAQDSRPASPPSPNTNTAPVSNEQAQTLAGEQKRVRPNTALAELKSAVQSLLTNIDGKRTQSAVQNVGNRAGVLAQEQPNSAPSNVRDSSRSRQGSETVQPSISVETRQQAPFSGPDLKANLINIVSQLSTQVSQMHQESNVELPSSTTPLAFPAKIDANIQAALTFLSDSEMSTGTLLKLAASLLNRIHFNQLHSAYQSQQNAGDSSSWFIELPIVSQSGNVDVSSLRVDWTQDEQSKDSKNQTVKKHAWSIQLSFDFDDLGKLHINAQLIDNQVKTQIWAESEATHRLVQKEKDAFAKRLEEAGLASDHIECICGQPDLAQTDLTHQLVSTRV